MSNIYQGGTHYHGSNKGYFCDQYRMKYIPFAKVTHIDATELKVFTSHEIILSVMDMKRFVAEYIEWQDK